MAIQFLLLVISCDQEPAIKRELYLPAPGENTAQWISLEYVGDSLTLKETRWTQTPSEGFSEWKERVSQDNGRSWSDFKTLKTMSQQLKAGGMELFNATSTYDSILSNHYYLKIRRVWPGRNMSVQHSYEGEDPYPWSDHTLLVENGQEREVKYEPGPDFDPKNPFDTTYLKTNRSYMGQKVVTDADGTAYFPIVCYRNKGPSWFSLGGVLLMRRDPRSGQLTPSNQRYISPNISSSGLQEPEVAVLNSGKLLIICRGSNYYNQTQFQATLAHVSHPDSLEGRAWHLISNDGGKTLSPVMEFRYDDGSRFFAPSSIHRLIRSSRNGKLYWIANILAQAPEGGNPRYPLCIAEIDEEIPAVRKKTLTVIDDREESEHIRMQLSNFSAIENRESLDFEIYVTRLGEDPQDFWRGAVYRYTFSPAR